MTAAAEPGPAVPVGAALGPDWVRGSDGLRYRRAARVILLDEVGRVLLVRGHDVDLPERSWWFTVGGGIGTGEDARTAAVREVREETGIALDPRALVGPVLTRSAVFDFYAERCRQDEEIFLARTRGVAAEGLSRDGWTSVERDVLDGLRWWDVASLAEVSEQVYPEGLADLVAGLLAGWDGVTRHLGGTGAP